MIGIVTGYHITGDLFIVINIARSIHRGLNPTMFCGDYDKPEIRIPVKQPLPSSTQRIHVWYIYLHFP